MFKKLCKFFTEPVGGNTESEPSLFSINLDLIIKNGKDARYYKLDDEFVYVDVYEKTIRIERMGETLFEMAQAKKYNYIDYKVTISPRICDNIQKLDLKVATLDMLRDIELNAALAMCSKYGHCSYSTFLFLNQCSKLGNPHAKNLLHTKWGRKIKFLNGSILTTNFDELEICAFDDKYENGYITYPVSGKIFSGTEYFDQFIKGEYELIKEESYQDYLSKKKAKQKERLLYVANSEIKLLKMHIENVFTQMIKLRTDTNMEFTTPKNKAELLSVASMCDKLYNDNCKVSTFINDRDEYIVNNVLKEINK